MAPGTEVKPPRISTGSAFSAISEIENCTPSLAPQIMPATSATRPDTVQTISQMVLSGMPTDCAACVIVGDGAQRAADARLLEEDARARSTSTPAIDGGDQVAGIDQQAALEDALEQEDRLLGQAEIDLVDVAAPQRLAEAVEEIGDAERRHEQDDAFLVDERAQHQALDGVGEQRP